MWSIFLSIIGLFLGTLGGLFSLGIFTKRTTSTHAWIGALASVAALTYVTFSTSLNGLLFGAIGTLVCLVVGLISSYLIPARDAKNIDGLTVGGLKINA